MSKEVEGKLGLGVLGLGEGRSIISAGMSSPHWDVKMLCDLNEELCRERGHEFGLEEYTASLDDMLAREDIDLVGIYTPDSLHADHIIACLQAGKHVICTKPFIADLTQAKAVLEAARESGKHAMVGQSSRFFAPLARQHEHFTSGELGSLTTVETYYNADHRWYSSKPWVKGSSSFKWLYSCISHPIDLTRWYMPDIEEVFGYADLSENGKAMGLVHPDTFHYVLKDVHGRIGRVSGVYSCPVVPGMRDSHMSCILRCTGGASQADLSELRYTYTVQGRDVQESFEKQVDHYFRFAGHTHHAGEYQNYIDYFAECLADGTTPLPDVREGIVTVALMQAMEESSLKGKPVRVRSLLERYGLEELD